jgi:hypothetical protein
MKLNKNTFSTLVLESFFPSIANCRILKFKNRLPLIYRYLMTRLSSLPVTSCIVDWSATYIMVFKFRISNWPPPPMPPPQLSLHRRAALSSTTNGTRSVYITERTQKAVYIVRYLWVYQLDTGTHKYVQYKGDKIRNIFARYVLRTSRRCS